MSERLHGDRPISHPRDNAFGLASFADSLATSLLQMSPKDGLVISVEAPWGAGKSSAIALALRTIKMRVLIGLGEGQDEVENLNSEQLDTKWSEKAKARRVHIVRFNPWNFSGQENLVRAFFKELAAQIDVDPDGALKKAMNRISGYLPSVVGGLAGATALAAGYVPAAGAAATAGRAAGEAAERALKSDVSLETARQTLVAALREAGQRIVVIVDDIDRLMPAEMRAVFSLVKSLGDLPNVLYVLAFDESVVKWALQDGVERVDAEFLEKIVQVSLKLPPPWRGELRKLLAARLNAITGDAEFVDEERWRRMYVAAVDPYLKTPRDIARLSNTLQVIWPNVKGDVDLADLIALTTLQLFDRDVYARIRDEIEVIAYAEYRFGDDKKLGERMEPTFARRPDVAKDAMASLFPRLAKVWNSFLMDGSEEIIWKEHRRICTKEYHRNYFVFGRDARMLSRESIEAVLRANDPASALLATLKPLVADKNTDQSSRVANFLDQVATAVYANPLLTPNFLRALLDHADDLIRREDEAWDFFVTHNDDRIRRIISLGISRLDAARRNELLDIFLSHPNSLQIRAAIIEDDASRHGLFGNKRRHETDWLFSADRIKDAALAISDEIARACEAGDIWNAPMPVRLIWTWKRLEGGERFDKWIKRVIADDALVVRLANELPGRSYQTGGGKGPRILWTFQRAHWTALFDVDELFSRLENLASSNEDAAATLERLRNVERTDKEQWVGSEPAESEAMR